MTMYKIWTITSVTITINSSEERRFLLGVMDAFESVKKRYSNQALNDGAIGLWEIVTETHTANKEVQ